MSEFDEIWERVLAHKGASFRTVARQDKFTYDADQTGIYPKPSAPDARTNRTVKKPISKEKLRDAWEYMRDNRVDGPSGIPGNITGPSYVYAILTDPRIKGDS